MNNEKDKASFILHSIYTKDISFESPKTPQIFNLKLHPNLDFDLQTKVNEIEKDMLYEVILKISVIIYSIKEKDKKIEKDETAFLIEIQQAGLFYIKGFEDNKKKYILSTDCPSALFPYAREIISNIVVKGGFPQIILPPINFSMINKLNKSNNTE
jgi:preprotein translocase subunit SecB